MKLSLALRLAPSALTGTTPKSFGFEGGRQGVAFVGAGGKTTALFQLARELTTPLPSALHPSSFIPHPSQSSPHPCALLTATTHLHVNQIELADSHWIAQKPEDLVQLEENLRGVVLVTGLINGDRTKGVNRSVLYWLREVALNHHLPLLVEADGSRQKPLKAPAEHEPAIPEFVETVVVVAGLSGLGKPLTDEWVHRAAQFERLGESANQRAITAEMVVKVLLHPEGGLKNIPPQARRIVLLNQADTAEQQSLAGRMAGELLPHYDAVIAASLQPQTLVYSVHEKTAGIILAAGASERLGQPKQLLDWRGQPFVRAVAQTALAADLSPVIVVTGSHAEEVEAVIKDLPVEIIRNPDWQSGQSSSIRAGLADLSHPLPYPPLLSPDRGEKGRVAGGRVGMRGVGAAIFLLADQPQVPQGVLRALVERHSLDLSLIVAPQVQGRRANPVLFDRDTFPDLLALTGDVGGRGIFSKHPLTILPWHDESLLLDVDTPEDYERLEGSDREA